MLAIKKNLQKYFKSLGYFLFKILYGKINEVINTENSNEIEIHSIKKAKKELNLKIKYKLKPSLNSIIKHKYG